MPSRPVENVHRLNILDFAKRRPSLESGRQKLRAGDALGALHDLERAARTDAHAHTFIAMLYEVGRPGVSRDLDKAEFHYCVAIDDIGAVEAWLGLARLCTMGDAEMRDYVRAQRCYRGVTEDADHPVAWLGLGRLYRDGLGVEVDQVFAEACFRRAWNRGNRVAYHELAVMFYAQGETFKALCKAIAWRLAPWKSSRPF